MQAILIMGSQWMGRVNNSLDELEDSMKSVEIKEDNLKALREEEQRHKVKNKKDIYKFIFLYHLGRIS